MNYGESNRVQIKNFIELVIIKWYFFTIYVFSANKFSCFFREI